MKIEERIRLARKGLGLTQTALAAAMQIKQSSLSDIERGETVEITGKTLIAIAAALRVRPAWIMGTSAVRDDDAIASVRGLETLISAYSQLPDDAQDAVLGTAIRLLGAGEKKPVTPDIARKTVKLSRSNKAPLTTEAT